MERDLAVITSYYNPLHYKSRRENFRVFANALQAARVPLFVIENAFGADSFELENQPGLIRIRGGDVLWQKERILNLAISNLPDQFTKVAWLDGDILFENQNWYREASERLDKFPVIQLFDKIVRLPRDASELIRKTTAYLDQIGRVTYQETWGGFASIQARDPQNMLKGDFAAHGHTGFAWAIRREIVAKFGLYDACIAGSGDHMMAHAFCGDWDSACIDRILGDNNRHRTHFEEWCNRIYPLVRSKVGFISGTIFHLWHGETETRRYVLRNRELAAFAFDPRTDIRIGSSGLWEWAEGKDHLKEWARDYFKQRNEDGELLSA